MADELYLTADVRFTKGTATSEWVEGPWTVDVTGTKHRRVVQTIGPIIEALDIGDVGAGGYIKIRNLSATNTVLLYGDASGLAPLVELLPGDVALFRVYSAATPAAVDITGTGADVEFELVEL